ncbi:ketopantoate reductase PanE/ApbA C terminal-domain-containing protein [Apiospora kogelbergensis]|uniref:ketopantoate reductase PanE/ApbA C terminal-domain-containing protein n=1 Tax=Apiospora kogelbergensis TaxID=1337665 RepID=UPI00312FE602
MTTRCISIPARDNQAPRISRNAQISLTKFDEKSPDTEDVDKRRRRIFVFGVGNLGRLFASSLAKLRQPPPITLVVHRRHMLDSWHKTPGIVMIRDGEADRNCLDVDIEWWTDEKPEIGPVREPGGGRGIFNLIMATKAMDVLPQLEKLQGYLSPESTVAFTQNGMCPMWPPQGVDYNARHWPGGDGPNWIACVTTHGVATASRTTFEAIHNSQGAVTVGPVLLNGQKQSNTAYLVQSLARAPHLGGRAVSRGELWTIQLEKLVVNSVINPLTATLGCVNGDIFEGRAGKGVSRMIDSLIREASSVLQALVSNKEISSEILQGYITTEEEMSRLLERFSFDSLRAMVLDVGHRVRINTSSMLQDVQSGRPTEIRAFNGWLVETAALLDPNLRLPTHEILITLVEAESAPHIN